MVLDNKRPASDPSRIPPLIFSKLFLHIKNCLVEAVILAQERISTPKTFKIKLLYYLEMKVLKPSSKERKRYILIKIKSSLKIEKGYISRLVAKAGLQFLGEFGMAKAGIQVLPETVKDSTAIVRVGHKYVNEAKAALALVKEFEGKKVSIQSIKVSGTVDNLKRLV